MRHALIGLLLLGATLVAAPANAQVSVSIGINVPAFPTLVRIPDYPVYYAPSLRANYFFYDGLYWVFGADGNWYESPWYNGPWELVDPFDVPVFLLRVPVRYYHARPAWFRGWAYDAPPHWGSHWGSSWQSRHAGWDRWNRSSSPAPAPLPTYQRSYSGSRYPVNTAQQAAIQTQNYSYTPRDRVAQQRFQERRAQARSAPQQSVIPAQAGIQERRQPRAQQAQAQQQQQRVQQAQSERLQRSQQMQAQRQERAQQAQAQQQQRAQQAQARGQERAQQAQAQRQERAQQAQARGQERAQQAQAQRQEREQQHENRGEGQGKGRDRHDNG